MVSRAAAVNAPNGLGSASFAGLAAPAPRVRRMALWGALAAPFDKNGGRVMRRLLGVSMALWAALALCAAGAASGGSWDERVFTPGSHLDFDAVAAEGASAVPGLIERGRELFKAKFTTVDGAGRPKATQAIIPTKVKNGVNPPFSRTSGPDSNSCFGCHNDPIIGGSADDVANV